MALPQLTTPEYDIVIPSTQEKIKFRPFLVKEEKILYFALEGRDESQVYDSIVKILESCILTPNINVNKFTSYDLEYLFLKLRSKSVSEIININLKHADSSECQASTSVQINIDDVNIKFNEEHVNVIEIGNGIGIKMKDPDAADIMKLNNNLPEIDRLLEVLYRCVDFVYDEKETYDDFSREEFNEFIDKMSQGQFQKVVKFFETMPKVSHEVSYTCKECGKEETVVIEGMQSFFT